MGSGSSPSIAGRMGTAFLRRLREKSKHYQGRLQQNMWWDVFAHGATFDRFLGHGVNLIGDDGLPAALVWSHCDDFLIHGPTLAKTTLALCDFLDYAVGVGLLCHPGKLTPPAQSVKYAGLIFDTRATPILRVPETKRVKAIALCRFTIHHRDRISRLSLSVVAGVLESLVEATPGRQGHTHLRNLQPHIHPTEWNEDFLPYYSFAFLTLSAIWSGGCLRSDGTLAVVVVPNDPRSLYPPSATVRAREQAVPSPMMMLNKLSCGWVPGVS
jgi:hypothetical protein